MTAFSAMNKLTKWRNVFASWQLGTRLDTDGECKAVKDHREVTIIMRVEISAITDMLLRKGILTQDELEQALERESKNLDHAYELRFPGFRTTQGGVDMDLKLAQATMRKMGFPP